MADTFTLQGGRIWIDPDTKEEDKLLLLNKINLLCRKVKTNRERLVVLICLEDVEQFKGGKK